MGSTGVIPYSHLISDSDSLIAGAKPRAALLLQAIMPFGVKMEAMETEETWKNLVKFVEEKVKMNGNGKDEDEDDEVKKVREKYFGVSKQLKELLHFRLHGPRFPRDMDAASVEEK